MEQKKNTPRSLKVAHEIVNGLVHSFGEERQQYADFYRVALWEDYQVQNINKEEYKLLDEIVVWLLPNK